MVRRGRPVLPRKSALVIGPRRLSAPATVFTEGGALANSVGATGEALATESSAGWGKDSRGSIRPPQVLPSRPTAWRPPPRRRSRPAILWRLLRTRARSGFPRPAGLVSLERDSPLPVVRQWLASWRRPARQVLVVGPMVQ